MNIYGNSNDDLENAILTNTTLKGSTTIICDDDSTYNLQTADNGNNLDVLTTDGAGNTYWSVGGGGSSTFQDVYNNSSNPANIVLVNNKPIIFKDILDQVAFTISSDGINTQAGGVNGGYYNSQMNTIKRADIGDTKIEIIENIPLTTIRTTFTEDQEFITKKYIDDLPPSNPFNQSLNTTDSVNFNIATSSSFIKTGGTSNQYLMGDGTSLQYSQNSGNSNFYLYDSQNGVGSPPIPSGHIEYNNAVQASATILYISHITTDGIDIDIFLAQITTIQDVYIQDKNSSLNFIKYNITGTPTLVINNYIAIPILYTATIPPALPNGAGTGLTSFGPNHPIIVSFFTNSIEVDTRLSTLETKTQNQSAILNTTTFAGNILSNADNTYDIGNLGSQFRRGYFLTALRCPSYDSIGVPLNIADSIASAVNIGRSGLITTILGTTNINSVYTLPNTAPAIGNVLTCSALGVSSWITPSPTAYSFLYPFPVISKSATTAAGTRTLACSYTMATNFTFTNTGVFLPSLGTDLNRVGIYRGDLTTGVLVGQTANFAPTANYNVKPLVQVVGQSLAFTLGQQIVLVWTQSGSGTSIATTTGVSNIALAFLSATAYTSVAFPTNISAIPSPAATTIRMCIDLS